MPDPDAVILQYSQTDRDLLRDTSRDVKRILEAIGTHSTDDERRFALIDQRLELQSKRLGRLETWHTRVSAVVGFVGFLLGLAVSALRYLVR